MMKVKTHLLVNGGVCDYDHALFEHVYTVLRARARLRGRAKIASEREVDVSNTLLSPRSRANEAR